MNTEPMTATEVKELARKMLALYSVIEEHGHIALSAGDALAMAADRMHDAEFRAAVDFDGEAAGFKACARASFDSSQA